MINTNINNMAPTFFKNVGSQKFSVESEHTELLRFKVF